MLQVGVVCVPSSGSSQCIRSRGTHTAYLTGIGVQVILLLYVSVSVPLRACFDVEVVILR
jgi:hypothetical protein